MKKKVKRFFLVLVFLIPLLYFAFTLFFFSPFEDDFGELAFIVPRDVDLFFSKVDMADDFGSFPEPVFFQDLKVDREWRTFTETKLFGELFEGRTPDEILAEVRDSIRDLPIDPIADVLGRQVAFAGNFDSEGVPSSFVAFFRASFKTKLAYELMTWDMLRGFAGDPMIAESTVDFDPRGFVVLTLADEKGTTYFLKRCADVIIAGTSETLMEEVAGLVDLGKDSIDLSLGGTQAYRDKIELVLHEDEDLLDFHVNLDTYFERIDADDELKANDIDFSVMTAMDIFDPAYFESLTGTLDFDDSLVLKARSEFHTQVVQEAKTGFFDQDSVDLKGSMAELAGMLPPDLFVAGCARLDLQPFLSILEKNLDPELRTLINDLVREGGRHSLKWKLSGTWEFIEYLDRVFGQKVYFALRARAKDKPIEPFEQPMPIVALIFEIEDHLRLDLLEEVVINLQDNRRQAFDMSKLSGDRYGCEIKIIDPKGLEDLETITYTRMGERYFVLATSLDLIEDIVRAWARPEPRYELQSVPLFERAMETFNKYGNLALFVDMEGLRSAVDDYAEFWGSLQIEQTPEETRTQRKQVKARVQRREGMRATGGRLSEADAERLEELVDEEMIKMLEARIEREAPEFARQFRERWTWMPLFQGLALSVHVTVHSVDWALRLETTLERAAR